MEMSEVYITDMFGLKSNTNAYQQSWPTLVLVPSTLATEHCSNLSAHSANQLQRQNKFPSYEEPNTRRRQTLRCSLPGHQRTFST
jgi:hypothetical protein